MVMWKRVEPSLRHIFLGGFAVIRLQQCHCQSFDVQSRVRKRALTSESNQIPIHEKKIIRRRIADEDWNSGQALEPGHIVLHRLFRRLQILPAGLPGLRLGLPPFHRFGVRRGTGQGFKISRKGSDQGFVGQVGRRAKAQHRIDARNGPVGLDIGADVDFRFIGHKSFLENDLPS